MRSLLPIALATAASCLPATVSAQSAPSVPFEHPDGTTHWYRAVAVPAGIDWVGANHAAALAGGYLATIQDGPENALVFGMIDDAKYWHQDQGTWLGPWVGGLQEPNAPEPADGWGWANLDGFAYTHWTAGQPDNAANDDRIHFGGSTTGRVDTWADGANTTKVYGYVIEFSGATVPTTLGLGLQGSKSSGGYTLLNPWFSKTSYLLDDRGRVAHTWNSQYRPGMVDYLVENGNLLRAGFLDNLDFPDPGAGGVVEELDWNGNQLWEFRYSDKNKCLHHDIERLPNGNVLCIAWDRLSSKRAKENGRDPAALPDDELWPDKIIEIEPDGSGGGRVVWEWRAQDHFIQDFDSSQKNFGVVADHPELIDINYEWDGNPKADWMHSNAIAYNAKLDQIMLSVRDFNEVWVIDHSTTKSDAKGHTGGRSGKGGDILYRWGNPAAYRRGTVLDQQLFLAHDTHWIADGLNGAGNMLVFNNGRGRLVPHSTVDEVVLPTPDSQGNYAMTGNVWGPAAPTWTYIDPNPTNFFAAFVSGAQRLENGNTLICAGSHGWVFEVTSTGEKVWDYVLPVNPFGIHTQGDEPKGNIVFRAKRYMPNYPAFANRTLTPGRPIEIYESGLLIDGSRVSARVRVGETATLSYQTASANQGKVIQFGTSATAGLFPVDSRFVPVAVDSLLVSSARNSTPSIFDGYSGFIDSQGRAEAKIHVPPIPVLAGLELHSVAVLVDKNYPSRVGGISNAVIMRITP